MKKILRILLLLCILISFFIFLKATDLSASVRILKKVGVNYIWILVCTAGAYMAAAIGWMFCIDSPQKPSLMQLFIYRNTCNAISLFNPTGVLAGEWYNRRMLVGKGCEKNAALQSVVLTRIMMIISQITILFAVFLYFFPLLSKNLSWEARTCLLVFLLISGFLLFLLIRFLLKKRENSVPENRSDKKWKHYLSNIKLMFLSLGNYMHRRPWRSVLAFVFFMLHWILGSMEFFFILYFLGYSVKIWHGLFMDTVVIAIKSMAPFIPGQIGVEELGNKFVLSVVGFNSAGIWLSVSILRRFRQLFWSALGFLSYKRQNKIIEE